jgi:hypothetical protein
MAVRDTDAEKGRRWQDTRAGRSSRPCLPRSIGPTRHWVSSNRCVCVSSGGTATAHTRALIGCMKRDVPWLLSSRFVLQHFHLHERLRHASSSVGCKYAVSADYLDYPIHYRRAASFWFSRRSPASKTRVVRSGRVRWAISSGPYRMRWRAGRVRAAAGRHLCRVRHGRIAVFAHPLKLLIFRRSALSSPHRHTI